MKYALNNKRASEAGFTLVELAIVLVIIGLIVGGVLVGQDLIKAAEIRSTVTNFEKFNAAALTFRNKYDGLPGDLLAPKAAAYGMTWVGGAGRTGAAGRGDGNGVIEGCLASDTKLGCETAAFWIDLTVAQLISDSFVVGPSVTTGSIAATGSFPQEALATIPQQSRYLPNAPLRDNAFIHIYPGGGRNFYGIHSYASIATTGIQTLTGAGVRSLTAAEASQIDQKMDDGIPSTGTVTMPLIAANLLPVNTPTTPEPGGAAAATGICVIQGAAAGIQGDETYNTSNASFANELNCFSQIRASF